MEEKMNQLAAIIAESERMRGAYFWTPPQSASMRRTYERKHTHPRICWEENGHKWTAEYTVQCSCRNIYAKGIYTKDGAQTTLTAIRNSLKRMESRTISA